MTWRYDLQKRHWLFISAAWLLGFIMWGTLLAVAPVLTTIGQELGLVYSEMGLVFSFPVLMLAIFAFPGGLLTDRIGPRKTGAIGAALIGVGGLMRGTSTDFYSLLVFSAVFGLGFGISLPTLPKVIGGWLDAKLTGTATGIYATGIYVGAGIATAVVFLGSWKAALISWGILSVLVALVWWVLVRDPPKTPAKTQTSARSIVSNRHIWILTAIFFLGAHIPFYTLTGWLPTILAINAPTVGAALVASLLSFFAAIATLIIPVSSDRLRRRKPFLWAPAIAGAGASYLVFTGTITAQVSAIAVLGIAIGAIFVISFLLPIELVSKDLVGSATGFMLIAYTGGIIGPWLAGFARDITSSFAPTMIMLILAFVAAAGLSFFLPETGKKPRGQVEAAANN